MVECLISLIVPVYNVESYVRNCLDSLIRQTYSNIEIICVNDCSGDASGEICDEFAAMDNRISVIHKRVNEGLSEARNTGLNIARGEYIAFIDSDDWIDCSYVEILYDAICSSKADIVQCSYVRVANEAVTVQKNRQVGKKLNMTGRQAIKKLYSNTLTQPSIDYTVVWNKLYRRTVIERIRFPKGAIFEDQFFTYRCFERAERICVLDCLLYYYRDNGSSITKQEYNIRFQDDIKAHEEQIEHFLGKKDYEIAKIIVARIEPLCINHYLRACFFELDIERRSAYKYAFKYFIKYLKNDGISVSHKLKVFLFLIWPDFFFWLKMNVDYHLEE